MSRKLGVLLSYVLMIFEVLSTLLLTPFIIRTLGQAEYGVYKLVVSINAYLLLLDLGIGNAIIRYITKYRIEHNETKERQFLAVANIFYIVIAFIAIIAGIILVVLFPLVFSKGLTDSEIRLGQTLLSITMINSAVTLGTTTYNNVLIAYEKFLVSRLSSIIQIILRIVFTFIVLFAGWGSIGIVVINLLMTLVCRVFFVIYVTKVLNLKPLFKGINFSFIKEIILYSSLLLLQMLATQLNSTVDQILIGALVTSSSIILAVYGVGSQIVQYYQTIGSAFTGVLMPGVVKMTESGATASDFEREMIRIGRIIFIILSIIFCAFVVNGQEFVILWAGNENSEAYIVAIILMFAYLFILTESIGSQVLWAMNKHREQAILKTIIVLLNIVLTILLIMWNPLIGATIGTFISLFLGDIVVMNIIFKIKLKINLKNYYFGIFKGIIPCLITSTLIGFVIKQFLPTGWLWFCLKVFIMLIVYGVAMLLFGANFYEKQILYSILKKINLIKKK